MYNLSITFTTINTSTGIGYYASPVGDLRIESEGDAITIVHFVRESEVRREENITSVVAQCIEELQEYFFKGRKFFTVELAMNGSDFQKKVWNELLTIPYGKTASYEDIAIGIGDLKSTRAVGLANGQNPIAIIVPCHRVIGKNGDLTGYGGGMKNKEWLLEHEGSLLKQLSLF